MLYNCTGRLGSCSEGNRLLMQIDIAAIIPRWTMHASLITLFGKPFVDAVDSVRLGLDNFLSHFDHFDRLFEVRITSSMHESLDYASNTSCTSAYLGVLAPWADLVSHLQAVSCMGISSMHV